MGVSRIVVRIRELVLEGVAPADRRRVGAGLEGELARLLARDGTVGATTARALDGGAVTVSRHASPERVGAQIGQAVHRRLGGGRGGRP